MVKFFRKVLLNRVVVVMVIAGAIVLQLLFLINMLMTFHEYSTVFYVFSLVLSAAAVLWIVYNDSNPAYKIAWIIPILLVPILGGIFYLFFGGNQLSRRERRKMAQIEVSTKEQIIGDAEVREAINARSRTVGNQSAYIQDYAFYPPYEATRTEYFPVGERFFERLLQELRGAEHFIFLEFFIIKPGLMWDAVLDILEEKAAGGVEVRVIYDDFGCLFTLPNRYFRELEARGIACSVFNPLSPVLSTRFNTRDHRKIVVIDGHTAFTGGINLADEYINAQERFGHWKDMGIMVGGPAVWSFTVMFLTLWDFIRGDTSPFPSYRYRPETDPHAVVAAHTDGAHTDGAHAAAASDTSSASGTGDHLGVPEMPAVPGALGFVQPFSDNPLDNEPVGEYVYLNMISKAKRFVYITTPYLIIDSEMIVVLCAAAKSGVDVRIITPHHPDKWYVHEVTRANYEILLENGVRIWEYTPGFIHGKTYVVDDQVAVVGTINMDFRSLYLHFECGVWLYRTATVADIHADFEHTLERSQEIILEAYRNVPWYRWLLRVVLKVFSPMM